MSFDDIIRVKQPLVRCLIAELFGTVVLVFIAHACGSAYAIANANAASASLPGKVMGSTFGAGLAAFIALSATMHISGGHLNPAVTFSLASVGLFPWSQVIPYMIVQYIGGFIAGALVWLTYYDAIQYIHGLKGNGTVEAYMATSHMFATSPAGHATIPGAFWGTFFGSAVFLLGVIAVVDHRNLKAPKWFYPLGVAFVLMIALAAFCGNGGPSVNPAADLSPRVFAHLVGWSEVIWAPLDGHFWWLVGFLGPHLGATAGLYIYKISVGAHIPPELSTKDASELDKLNAS